MDDADKLIRIEQRVDSLFETLQIMIVEAMHSLE